MPLRIDTSKCDPEKVDTDFMRTLAEIMYAVGVGQIRDEAEAKKLYRRYVKLRIVRDDMPQSQLQLFPYAMMHNYIGAHTNVSDVSDFQFGKQLLAALAESADVRLAAEMRLR